MIINNTFGRIDVVSSLEMKVLPTSVDNIVATLKVTL